jgi:hypothetical protein
MTRLSDERVVELLRAAMPAIEATPPASAWSRVRAKIERNVPAPPLADWLLVAALALLCLLRPALVGILLVHV